MYHMYRWRNVRKVFALTTVMAMLLIVSCQSQPSAGTSEELVTEQAQEDDFEEVSTPTPGPVSSGPIKVGLASVFTGPIADIGNRYEKGMILAIEDLGGEIGGLPIELVTADNKCNPSDAVTAVRFLIDTEEVAVILGSGCSGATLGSLPEIQEGETAQVTVASTNPTIYDALGVGGNEWGFRINIDDVIMVSTFASYIAEENDTVFTIAENNDFGRGAISAYLEELPNVGVEVVGSEYFDLETTDMRPILTNVKALDPDALLIVTTEELGNTLLRQIREIGIGANIYSRGNLTTPLFRELTADDPSIGEGIIEANFWAEGLDPAGEKRWGDRWDAAVSLHPMMAYYGMRYVIAPAIACAIEETGQAGRAAIRDCLEKTSVVTPLGQLEFDNHNQAYPNMTLSTIAGNRTILLDVISTEPVER